MSLIKTITSGPFQTNCWLIGPDNNTEVILIDAPPDCYAQVKRFLENEKRSLAAVLITHPHFDHVLDTPFFAREGVPVYAHEDAVSGIVEPETLGMMDPPPGGFPDGGVSNLIAGGTVLHLAGLAIDVREVPGHSAGSLAFYFAKEKVCFVGDVLFHGSIGRTDLPGGDFDLLAESIQTQLYSLGDDVLIHPGHGSVTSVGYEKRSNPFVRG
jgi:glyoxylase-like metal-dependent hydrolase (beta-lactamase superfamily II)